MVKKFLRRTTNRYVKLGKGRKKKQTWRSPKGRDNKMREKRKGYPKVVSIGYSGNKKLKGKLNEQNPIMIRNINDLEQIQKGQIGILGRVGKKKKIEIVKKAKEKKINLFNVNSESFLKNIVEKKKELKEGLNKPEKKKEDSKKEKEKDNLETKAIPKTPTEVKK